MTRLASFAARAQSPLLVDGRERPSLPLRSSSGTTEVVVLLDSPPLARGTAGRRGERTPSSARSARAGSAGLPAPRSAGATDSSRTASRSPCRADELVASARAARRARRASRRRPTSRSSTRRRSRSARPALWGPTLDTAGQGMKIGIIDSGVDPEPSVLRPCRATRCPPGSRRGSGGSRPRR